MGKKTKRRGRRQARAFSRDELAGGDSPPRASRVEGVGSRAHPVTTSDGTITSPGEDRKRHNTRGSPGRPGTRDEADGVAGVDGDGVEDQADAVETTTEALGTRLSFAGAMDTAADEPSPEPRDFSWVPDVGFLDFVKGPLRALREALHGDDLRAVERSRQGTTDALAGSVFMNRWMGDAGAYAQDALAEDAAADRVDNA